MRPYLGFLFIAFSCATIKIEAQVLFAPPIAPHVELTHQFGYAELQLSYATSTVQSSDSLGLGLFQDNVVLPVISFSEEIKLEGKLIEPGEYSIYVIPSNDYWTVAFNHKLEITAKEYNSEHDFFRFIGRPHVSEIVVDKLAFTIEHQSYNQGYIRLAGGQYRLFLRFEFDIISQLNQKLKAQLLEYPQDAGKLYYDAAKYLYSIGANHQLAGEYIHQSLGKESHNSSAWWLAAQLQGAQDSLSHAIEYANKALELLEVQSDERQIMTEQIKKWQIIDQTKNE